MPVPRSESTYAATTLAPTATQSPGPDTVASPCANVAAMMAMEPYVHARCSLVLVISSLSSICHLDLPLAGDAAGADVDASGDSTVVTAATTGRRAMEAIRPT
eukprot:364218-Chlamydomonas_euryale.AAC.13